MSNFLDRLASSAAKPQPRLHPILGSIYAPAVPLAGADSFASSASSVDAETTAPSPRGTRRTWVRDSEATQLLPPTVSLHSDRSANEQPVFAPTPSPMSTTFRPIVVLADRGASDSASEVSGQNEAVHSSPLHADFRHAFPTAVQPLVSSDRASTSAVQPTRHPAPHAANTHIAKSESSRRAAQAQREPDEIHIHIGRIEIAAITPPASRPAPAAARKSLNLDDYLRRGSGRR